MGYLAETDRINALALAELVCVLDRHPDREKLVKPLPDAEQRQLQALMARRRQLVSMLVSERNRLATSHKVARRSIQAIILVMRYRMEGSDEAIGGILKVSLRATLPARCVQCGPLARCLTKNKRPWTTLAPSPYINGADKPAAERA